MLHNVKLPAIAMVAAGALLGYLAASGGIRFDRPADAAVAKSQPSNDGPPEILLAQAGKSADQKSSGNGKKPNILFIMGDDVGWFNIGAYHRGIMSGKTPNLDKLAAQGMLFTDYYAEASCTAGRANFITGEIPLRTGLTTVGQAGADVGIPAQACTLATALKAQGYATGQFGKNHLGDLNKFLPTVHGFDEFFRLPVPPRRHVGSVLVLVPGRSSVPRQIRPAEFGPLLRQRYG